MFSKEVAEQLQYYVYRLIDPRNGQTFYVGKGNNDIYETVRSAWKVNVSKVKNFKYCFAVLNGVVRNVYEIEAWGHRDY